MKCVAWARWNVDRAGQPASFFHGLMIRAVVVSSSTAAICGRWVSRSHFRGRGWASHSDFLRELCGTRDVLEYASTVKGTGVKSAAVIPFPHHLSRPFHDLKDCEWEWSTFNVPGRLRKNDELAVRVVGNEMDG